VSVEDADQLQDLRSFSRDLMQKMSVDLETKLDWVAVDHWDTDNPHTHIILRGRTNHGSDLVIAPDYMARGMRQRRRRDRDRMAGAAYDLEIHRATRREVDQERFHAAPIER